MSHLSPDAKDLLRRARAEFSPPVHRLNAVRSALATRMVPTSADVPSSAPSAQAMGASALRAAGWSTGHTLGAAILLGALGAGAYALVSSAPVIAPADFAAQASERAASMHPSPSSTPEAHTGKEAPTAMQAPPTPALERPSELRVAPPSLRSAARFRARTEAPRETPPTPANAVTPPASSAAPAEGNDSLAEEVRMLRDARGALDRGDATRALSLLDAHEARFPRGTLHEERLATRVLALCASGQLDAARMTAQELVRAAPRSPHLTRVRTSCVASPPSK